MKQNVLAASLVTVICICACATSHLAEFRTLYAQRAAVAKDRRLAEFLDETTDDYVVRLENGQTMTRNQLAKRLEAYFGEQLVDQLSFAYFVRHVDIRGDQAVVKVEQRDKRVQRRKDGSNHLVEANVIHTDTWIKTPAGWKLQLTQEGKQLKFTVDGKATQ